jgi:hypothetical protein
MFITTFAAATATLAASQKNPFSPFHYIGEKSTISQFAKETTRIPNKMDVLI